MADIIPIEEVDDIPLGHDQLGDIKSYLSTLDRYNVTELGQVLGLRYTTLRNLPHGGFLDQVMTLWLDEAEDVLKKGKPSWRSLVQGLRNKLVRQNGIANKIAKEHPTRGDTTIIQKPVKPTAPQPPVPQGSRVKPDSDEMEDTVAEAVAKVENPRGLAVIVTNEYNNYPDDQLPGMETDGQAMEDAFKSLGFASLWKRNISSEDMKVLVKSVVKYFQDNPPTEHYVVAFVFSGHGNEGDLLYGEDGRNVHLNSEIVEPLAAEHAIGNIPKLFFIDACRGESELKPVVRLRRKSARELITAKGNYYVAYSTIPKHVAYASDDPNSGSPWMQILAKNLKESEESISNIMETTSKELWGMYENDPSINIAQQTETVSRLHCGPVYLRQKADSLGADPSPQSRMETDPESDPKPGVSNVQHEIGQSKGKRTATGE